MIERGRRLGGSQVHLPQTNRTALAVTTTVRASRPSTIQTAHGPTLTTDAMPSRKYRARTTGMPSTTATVIRRLCPPTGLSRSAWRSTVASVSWGTGTPTCAASCTAAFSSSTADGPGSVKSETPACPVAKLAGLLDRREDNGKCQLDEAYLGQLIEVAGQRPTDYGFRRPTWTRELVVTVLQQSTGVGVHVTSMSRALRLIGVQGRDPSKLAKREWRGARCSPHMRAG